MKEVLLVVTIFASLHPVQPFLDDYEKVEDDDTDDLLYQYKDGIDVPEEEYDAEEIKEDGKKTQDWNDDASNYGLMQIYVKLVRPESFTIIKTIPLYVYPPDTIWSVKMQILDNEGYAPNRQRLIHKGNQLEDSGTIGNYNIKKESTLHLLLHPRGQK